MQKYGQPGYQRPGSTTGYPGAPIPPPYGAPQGYQSAAPQSQSQWAPPAHDQAPNQQWNQQPQAQAGGYNPGVYGTMPGGYSQAQMINQTSTAYPSQQDVPPPPPPKPAGFAAAVLAQQQAQNHTQQNTYGGQQGYPQPQQGGYQHQPYNVAAPPPPSQTPGGSYVPSPQTPQDPGRPGSIYGAGQVGAYSTPVSAVSQSPSTVMSPTEQQPAYIPPSLTGQGTQAYIPANTNPMPGVYVPPPPDIPAWQQAQHAPLEGGSKFKYTKPSVDSAGYTQVYPQQVQHLQQNQYAPQSPVQQQGQFGQFTQAQQPPQYGQTQHVQQPGQYQPQYQQQTPQSYNQPPPPSQTPQQYHQQQNQWQAPPADQGYGQQQNIQAPYVQQPAQQQAWQQYPQGQPAGIEEPRPVHTGTTPPGFVNQPSPQSQPVSPATPRQSVSYTHTDAGRTGSVSSIALGAIHAQRAGNRTSSPHPPPPPPKLPTPPPPRDDATKFSALGSGGPSDWEHFGADEEIDDEELFGAKKVEPEVERVELPAQVPSPVSAVSSPPSKNVVLDGHEAGYHSSPRRGGRGTPQEGFVMGDAPPQQTFVVGDAPPQHTFVMGDAPPPQQASHPPTGPQGFVVGDGGWSSQQASSQPQRQDGWEQQPNQAHAAEIRAKDEVFERQRAEHENETANLRREVEELKVVLNNVRLHAERERNDQEARFKDMTAAAEKTKGDADGERSGFEEKLRTLTTAAEADKNNAEALVKEKDAAIERWKEDAEGKDENVKEKEATIVELGRQMREKDDAAAMLNQQVAEKDAFIATLNQQLTEKGAMIEDFKKQLEVEKAKEQPMPTPACLVPDIDPWYAGSLERFVAMLKTEAHEPLVENKIKTFTTFLKAESGIRGIAYYDAPASAPAPAQHLEQPVVVPHNASDASMKSKDLNVRVPERPESPEDDYQYSPGGRPILRQRPNLTSEHGPSQQTFTIPGAASGHSTAILTPTSSQDDTFDDKTPTPMQSPPEESSQPLYKAYIPPGANQEQSANLLHRQSVSSGSATPLYSLQTPGSGQNNDEIFFSGQTSSNPTSRPATSTPSDVAIPPPLFASKAPSTKTPIPSEPTDPSSALANILPIKIAASQPNARLEKILEQMAEIPADFSFIKDLTDKWETATKAIRKKNDDARAKRQEESEERASQLFDDEEISYAEINVIEDEFKEQERLLKTREDEEEYESYATEVFLKIFERLQEQITSLTHIHFDTRGLLQASVSGTKSLEGSDAANTLETLRLLEQINDKIELHHEKVVAMVAERDRRYKQTVIRPLYAAGNIPEMKNMEKHFENAEKNAVARAKQEQADRLRDFHGWVEPAIFAAVSVEQSQIDNIVVALRSLPTEPSPSADVLDLATSTLTALKSSSKALLALLRDLEIKLNTANGDAAIAQAKAENAGPEKVREVQVGVLTREEGVREEFVRKMVFLEQDEGVIEGLVGGRARAGSDVKDKDKGKVKATVEIAAVTSDGDDVEREKKERLKRALEEAKRRNGDL